MKLPISILAGTCLCALPLLNSCRSSAPPPPPPVIEQHDVTVVQPAPKPKPKPVQRESAPEEFRAVTTPTSFNPNQANPMKIILRSIVCLLGLTSLAVAGGITGTVADGKGKGKSGITVSAKVGGQQISVTTDSTGAYVITVPAASHGQKAKVYASGTYVTTCTIPAGGEYARVNVTYK